MSHIFMSYSRNDSAKANYIARQIETLGFPVWIDRDDIHCGQKWRETIVENIRSASVLMVLLSHNSMQSDNVRKEIDLAEESGIRLLPVEIATCTIPNTLKYQLVGQQIISLTGNIKHGMDDILQALSALRIERISQRQTALRQKTKSNSPDIDLSDLGGAGLFKTLSRKIKGR